MSELRDFFNSVRPLGAKDPVVEFREGESITEVKPPKRAKRGYYVDLLVESALPEEVSVHLGFLVSKSAITRLQGDRYKVRLGLYRRARMEALNRVLQIVKKYDSDSYDERVSYQNLMSNQEYVEEMRVGPPINDPESLAMYVLIRNASGEKILAFTPVKKKITRASWDDRVTIDPELFRSLHLIAQKELRRLGTPA